MFHYIFGVFNIAMFYIFIFFVYQFIKCILSNSFEADFEAHFVAGDVALLEYW